MRPCDAGVMADEEFRHSAVRWSGGSVHVVEAGEPTGPPVLFLHGWPQSAYAWRRVMRLAGASRALAIDLPGIGRSAGAVTDGGKRATAAAVHEVVTALNLRHYTLVGHDIGG